MFKVKLWPTVKPILAAMLLIQSPDTEGLDQVATAGRKCGGRRHLPFGCKYPSGLNKKVNVNESHSLSLSSYLLGEVDRGKMKSRSQHCLGRNIMSGEIEVQSMSIHESVCSLANIRGYRFNITRMFHGIDTFPSPSSRMGEPSRRRGLGKLIWTPTQVQPGYGVAVSG